MTVPADVASGAATAEPVAVCPICLEPFVVYRHGDQGGVVTCKTRHAWRYASVERRPLQPCAFRVTERVPFTPALALPA